MAATAQLQTDMMAMLSTMNSTLLGQLAAQSTTIATQNTALNEQVVRIGQQAELISQIRVSERRGSAWVRVREMEGEGEGS